MRMIALLAALLISACASRPQVVERPVQVPVPVTRLVDRPVLPPASLLAPVELPGGDLWVPPTAAEATACVTGPGEDVLLRFLADHVARLAALRAWAAEAQKR